MRGVEQQHLFACLGDLRDRDAQELDATFGPRWTEDDLARQWTQNQVDGLTIFDGDRVAACLVAWEPTPGHWTCGMVTTTRWNNVAFAACRYLKRYLWPVLMGNGVRRASCVVDANYAEAVRWLGFLDFEIEGRLRRYGQDGRDFLITAMVPTVKYLNDGDEDNV